MGLDQVQDGIRLGVGWDRAGCRMGPGWVWDGSWLGEE